MITLTTCLAPRCVQLARRHQPKDGHEYLSLRAEIKRLSGPAVHLGEDDFLDLCIDIWAHVGVPYLEPSGFSDEVRFDNWPDEHRVMIPLVNDIDTWEDALDFGTCCLIDHWFATSGFVDTASDMTTVNAVRSVISAAVNERGGIVVS